MADFHLLGPRADHHARPTRALAPLPLLLLLVLSPPLLPLPLSPCLPSLAHAKFLAVPRNPHRSSTRAYRVRAVRAPCTAYSSAKRVAVRTEKDLAQRLKYKASQTVRMLVYNNFWLSRGLALNSSFSCTVFQAVNKAAQVRILYKGWDAPVLRIVGAGNLLFVGVGLQNAVTSSAPACDPNILKYGGDTSVRCPALYIAESFGVQFTKAFVYGRIDIFRSAMVRIDSVKATMAPNSYGVNYPPDAFANHGVIRVGECSTGPTLQKAYIYITNNEVYGSWELITLYRFVTGVVVRNNYLHNYQFTAIRCGADLSYVMDCNFNYIAYNYIWSPQKTLTGDSAGIYICTHWFNPRNSLACNYIVGGDHCYYLDLATSATTISGGLCLYTMDGAKVATGKFNIIHDVIMLGLTKCTSFISCIASTTLTCYNEYGALWERVRKKRYNTPAINKAFAYMKAICNPVPTSYGGVPCNTPGSGNLPPSATGSCSGVPYGNDINVVLVGGSSSNYPKDYCKNLPAWSAINVQKLKKYTSKEAAFIGGGNYGLKKSSKIFSDNPRFRSCPRTQVGPGVVNVVVYFRHWNIPRPAVLNAIINSDVADNPFLKRLKQFIS